MRQVFFTGATGVIGASVLERLLGLDDTSVTLLLRGPSRDAVERRRDDLLCELLGSDGAAKASQVEVVRGDITKEKLGLEPADYERVTKGCTHIIHCAAEIRMNLPREASRAAAAAGTKHVLSLGRAAHRLRKLEIVSTIGVGGRMTEVPEQWITSPRAFHNAYEEAKAEAETLVQDASRELPVTVHRPSMVVGDSRTGRVRAFQVFYHLCEFLSGLRSRGIGPALGEATVDTVPMDTVVNALLWSLDNDVAAGLVLHPCSGADAMRLSDLQRLIREKFSAAGVALPALRALPVWTFRAVLGPLTVMAPPKLRRALRTAPVFLDYLTEQRLFHNEKTRAVLAASGIDIPLPPAYLPRVIDYYLERRTARPRVA